MLAKIRGWIRNNRALLLYVAAAVVFTGVFYLIRLGSFVRGDSVHETPSYLQTANLNQLFENISLGPLKFAEYAMQRIDQPNATLLRLLSVLVVVIGVLAFYRLIAKWHSQRVAILSTLLFATSSYSLHMARFTNQDVLYFMVVPVLLLFGTWMKSKKFVNRIQYILPAAALMLYIPGVIYIFGVFAIVFRKRIKLAFRVASNRGVIIASCVSGLLLMPLLLSLIMNPAQLSHYFAVDVLFRTNPLHEILDRLNELPHALFINGPNEPYRWLTGTPILDVASMVLLALGIYAYVRGPHTLRARTLGILLLMAVILFATGSILSLALVIPLLYIVIANGLAYLLLSWFTVFPRNPAARNTAVAMITILVLFICGYHLQRYFVAWPNSPQTKKALSVTSVEMIQ